MAINFPANPTVGDTVVANGITWTWSGATWKSKGAIIEGPTGPTGPNSTVPGPTGPQGKFTISDTAPSSPTAGDSWFDSIRGLTFVYYTDVNSSQWVQVGSANMGPTGTTGPSGSNGINGVTGPTGSSASITKTVVDKSANYSLAIADKNQAIRFTGSSPQTLTVDNVLDVGSSTAVFQDGTGTVNFSAGSGVTLLSPGFFSTRAQYSKVDVNCVAAGQYRLSGDVNTAVTVTGGTLTSDATYYYRTFTATGNLVISGATINADILVVGGGGSGGAGTGGGGGAGGLINISAYPLSASTYTVTIGAGGTNDDIDVGTSGGSTTVTNGIRTLTAIGGGYGGASETGAPGPTYAPASGGSGGGAQGYYSGNNTPGIATQPANTNDGVSTYAGTGYGNAGGSPSATTSGNSGGGGGAGAAGANGSSGAGGAGLQLSISGTSQWYAAGGGGGQNGTTSTNGIGGYHVVPSGTAGATNTGSGGGGGYAHAGGYGGNGGSGIVIVRYTRAQVGG